MSGTNWNNQSAVCYNSLRQHLLPEKEKLCDESTPGGRLRLTLMWALISLPIFCFQYAQMYRLSECLQQWIPTDKFLVWNFWSPTILETTGEFTIMAKIIWTNRSSRAHAEGLDNFWQKRSLYRLILLCYNFATISVEWYSVNIMESLESYCGIILSYMAGHQSGAFSWRISNSSRTSLVDLFDSLDVSVFHQLSFVECCKYLLEFDLP